MGEVEWSPTQARLFATLLDKCLPDLSASFLEDEQGHDDVCPVSRHEALAAAGEMERN
jgi:hypothetical protein